MKATYRSHPLHRGRRRSGARQRTAQRGALGAPRPRLLLLPLLNVLVLRTQNGHSRYKFPMQDWNIKKIQSDFKLNKS